MCMRGPTGASPRSRRTSPSIRARTRGTGS
jgi:hypothetical protein